MIAIPTAFGLDATAVAENKQEFLSRRGVLTLASIFWGWVTVTDIAYHQAMRIELAELTHVMIFFPWQYRLLQHLLMLPVLLACYSVAVRIGWWPAWPRVPQQLALAVGFSLLMYLMILAGGHFLHTLFGTQPDPFSTLTKSDWAMWAASGAMHLLAYGFGLALITVLAVQRGYHQLQLRNSELRRDWAGARLAALRTQLSPHTLFNVLHTIQARISGEPEVAETLIASLGDLLRGLRDAGERDFARLRDELQFVELYLSLQQGRFSDRLTAHVELFLADAPARCELLAPFQVGLCQHKGRLPALVSRYIGAQVCNLVGHLLHGRLQLPSLGPAHRLQCAHLRFGGGQVRFCRFDGGLLDRDLNPVGFLVELDQQGPFFHAVVVVDQHPAHLA